MGSKPWGVGMRLAQEHSWRQSCCAAERAQQAQQAGRQASRFCSPTQPDPLALAAPQTHTSLPPWGALTSSRPPPVPSRSYRGAGQPLRWHNCCSTALGCCTSTAGCLLPAPPLPLPLLFPPLPLPAAPAPEPQGWRTGGGAGGPRRFLVPPSEGSRAETKSSSNKLPPRSLPESAGGRGHVSVGFGTGVGMVWWRKLGGGTGVECREGRKAARKDEEGGLSGACCLNRVGVLGALCAASRAAQRDAAQSGQPSPQPVGG